MFIIYEDMLAGLNSLLKCIVFAYYLQKYWSAKKNIKQSMHFKIG